MKVNYILDIQEKINKKQQKLRMWNRHDTKKELRLLKRQTFQKSPKPKKTRCDCSPPPDFVSIMLYKYLIETAEC